MPTDVASDSRTPDSAKVRASRVVCGWLSGQLTFLDRNRVLLMEPDRPESRLLQGWMTRAGIKFEPAPTGARSLPHALADLLLDAPDCLPVVTHHKLGLLLDGAPNAALPLGDLWASDILEWAGDCTLPRGVTGTVELIRIEEALRQGLREQRLRAILHGLEGVDGAALEARIRRASSSLQGPLIPKLQALTIGMDLRLT